MGVGMCELLVVKRMVKTIYYSRLPTGHTHEDIDAIFGVIWQWFKANIVHTPSQFKKELKKAFKENESIHLQNLEVEDIFVVPDYQKFIEPSLIYFERMHTVAYTMHQWRFEAVPVSSFFPLGCKTCYRAYSGDRVVEIMKRPKQFCETEIGRLIGLEPVTTYVRWEPNAQANPGRPGIEGIFLLQTVPVVSQGEIPPAPFVEGFNITLQKLLSSIHSRFNMTGYDADVRKEWNEWISNAPKEAGLAGSKNFVDANPHLFRSPLLPLFRSSQVCEARWDLVTPRESSHSFPFLQWPNCIAFCMPSVITVFNTNPPQPRHNVISDAAQSMLERFKDALEEHYITLSRKTAAALVTLLR